LVSITVKEVKLESNAFPNRTFRNMAYFCMWLVFNN